MIKVELVENEPNSAIGEEYFHEPTVSTFRFELDPERHKTSKGMRMYLEHYDKAKDDQLVSERLEEKKIEDAPNPIITEQSVNDNEEVYIDF